MNEKVQNKNKGAFMHALIKATHPDWTQEQIDAEVEKKLNSSEQENDSAGCEYCSG